ncbi:MAG: tetraacyldisaccharide 4'-kinase [Planctomycetaceae bacterium]|nr:tetraacyldisaccharide 4'-kinase [Planctomycetaceae bacterium]
MSGRKCGVAATLLRAGLWSAQWPYRIGVGCKNLAFDFRLREPFEVGVPVISVGNLTTGGTGKTPVVAFLANWFRDAGVKVGLLSRGYKALTQASNPQRQRGSEGLSPSLTLRVTEANDEKLVLDQLCPGVPQWLNPDRILSAKRAVVDGCNLLILDDAFQHRRVHRDLDIVLIDATNPWGYGHCLPRGLLREPIANIERADLVVVTRTDQVSAEELTAIRTELVRHNQVGSVIEVSFRPNQLINSAGQVKPLAEVASQQVFGFCGIGNPDSFERTLRQLGSEVVGFESFPDHHHFTSDDLSRLAEQARSTTADLLLTTHKDLVKIHDTEFGGRPVWAMQIGTEIVRGAPILEARLWSILERVPKP